MKHGRLGPAALLLAMPLTCGGCVSARAAQVQSIQSNVALLETRVRTLEERQDLIEGKAWSQREDVSYLRGRVEGGNAGRGEAFDAESRQSARSSWDEAGMSAGGSARQPRSASDRPALRADARPTAKNIQTALKRAGCYAGPIDGKIGPKTREAIQMFQQRQGLSADGVVGKRTWAKLSPYLSGE